MIERRRWIDGGADLSSSFEHFDGQLLVQILCSVFSKFVAHWYFAAVFAGVNDQSAPIHFVEVGFFWVFILDLQAIDQLG